MFKKTARLSLVKVVLFSAVPTLILLILVFVAAEIGLRIRYRYIASITGINAWKNEVGKPLAFDWDSYHPVYGWSNLPGYRSDAHVPFKVTINSQGVRARQDYSLHAAPGIRRIAVLGDSCTFGEAVDDDQTLPYFLERSLKDVEILNFGVRGYGLGQMVLRLEKEVFSFNPDHILLVLTIPPDLERTVLSIYSHPKPFFIIEGGKLVVKNVPVPVENHHSFLSRHSYVWAWVFGRYKQKFSSDAMILSVSHALIENAKRLCNERGIPLTLVLITGPSWAQVLEKNPEVTSWVSEGRKMVRHTEAYVSDQIDLLSQLQQKKDLSARDEVHWSGRANCLLASSLAQELVRRKVGLSLSKQANSCPE